VAQDGCLELLRGGGRFSAGVNCTQFGLGVGELRLKLQWLRDPSRINGDNLNNVRREAKHFRNKKVIIYKTKLLFRILFFFFSK
jgi:hypothetical protein